LLIGGAIGVLALERHLSAAEENAVAFAARLDRTGVELPHASATNATSVEAGEGFLLVIGADGVLKCDPTETGQLVADTLKCVEAARSAAKKTGSGSLIGRSARDDAEDLLQRSLRRDEEAPGTRSKGEEGSMGARGYGVLPPPRSFPSHDLETGPFGMRPPIVAADKSAKALDVLRALDALAGVPLDVRAALSSPSQDAMADLYVGRPQQAIPFTIASRIASLATADEARGLGVFEPPPLTLGILVDGIDARVIAMSGRGGGAVTVSLDATLPSTRRQWEDAAQLDVRRLVIAPGATSDWQSAIDLVDAFNDPSSPLSQVCRRSHGCDVLLTADRGALEALANRPSATDLQAALSDAGIASQPSALSTVGHGTDAQEPSLHYGAPRVDGLPQGVAQSTIRMHSGSLRYCFEKRVNAAGPHAAKGTLSITVDSSGRTQSVTLSGIDDAELSSCITSVAKAWRFPMPTSGTATISQPLEFRR